MPAVALAIFDGVEVAVAYGSTARLAVGPDLGAGSLLSGSDYGVSSSISSIKGFRGGNSYLTIAHRASGLTL